MLFRSGQDPLNFPTKLNNQLAALRRSIETGDGKPTAQSYVVFKELSDRLDIQLKRLSQLLAIDLPKLNQLLGEARLEPVSTGKS